MTRDNNTDAFLKLVKAGLWGGEVRLSIHGDINYSKIIQLAEEQSVVGIVAAGIEKVSDIKVPKEIALQIAGQALQLEQRNIAMNKFVSGLVGKMRNAGIYTLLVKGQGVAQSYEKPLWRACGDVDLFLSEDNYKKTKEFLLPIAESVEPEWDCSKHLGMTIEGWTVELHGSLRGSLSPKINRELEEIKHETFYGGKVRSWVNNGTHIFLLDINNDVTYVFTHFLNHFYKGGIGLRQICDWCRLLWTNRESLNHGLLEARIRKMGLMSEWRTFGAFAVEYLGMPVEAMPMFDPSFKFQDSRFKRKAERIKDFIMMSGNFGHNRDMSYFSKYPYLMRKVISAGRRCGDVYQHAKIFPVDSIRFFFYIMFNGLRSASKGE